MQKSVALAALAATLVVPSSGTPSARVFSAAALADSADSVERMRVLWIGAHPDDEDTNIIAWLARGRGVETAYMSLTRGDGGQNLIGNELGSTAPTSISGASTILVSPRPPTKRDSTGRRTRC